MKRRTLFAGAGAVDLLTVLPAEAAAIETPILGIYREWLALRALGNADLPVSTDWRSDDEWLEVNVFAPMDILADKAMLIPCASPADFAAKMLMRTCNGDLMGELISAPDLVAEAMGLIRHA